MLLTEPIVWAGAKGGCAHLREPLPVSLWEEGCAWRAGALDALGREGRNYRIAYMSAHTAGQRAAIMSDLAVAPLPKSFLGNDMVELCAKDGMPEIGTYSLAMLVRPTPGAGQGGRRPYPRDLRTVPRNRQVLIGKRISGAWRPDRRLVKPSALVRGKYPRLQHARPAARPEHDGASKAPPTSLP